MNKQTLEALKGSIKKWHNIAYHDGNNRSSDDCPLCQLFPGACSKCPVAIRAKANQCRNTPYYEYARKPTKRNAVAMLQYLVCLLPKGESAEMSDGWIWSWE